MKYVKFILPVLVIVFLLYSAFIAKEDEDNKVQSPAPQRARETGLETKTDNQGQVTVKITPQNLSGAEWKFEIVLDTHSIDLNQDLMQVIELIDEQGKIHKPIAWEGAIPGGHHREGVLIFQPINPKPASVELKIKGVGGVLERSLKWYLK